MQFLEEKEIKQYIIEAENLDDFIARMNNFIKIFTHEVGVRLFTEVRYNFDVEHIIDEINKEIKTIIIFINENRLIADQPFICESLFIDVINISFPKYYDIYQYQKVYINN